MTRHDPRGVPPVTRSRGARAGGEAGEGILPHINPNRRMKRLKRVGVLLLGGFLAFAPPGTLILLASIALALFGKFWLIAGVWLLFKRKGRPRSSRG